MFQHAPPRLRCMNVRIGHGSKGHQLSDGRFFAGGDYVSSFSVETNRKKILNRIYFRLHHLLERFSGYSPGENTHLELATMLHRDETLHRFFTEKQGDLATFHNTKFCLSCLVEKSYYSMPCGHSLCRECIKAFGRSRSKTVIEVADCPFHEQSQTSSTSRPIYVRPDEAGIRILSLE